jgi:heme O synthase-like polyprenyltransferase
MSTVGAYVALTKPRIIELLLVTTLPTMVVAKRGLTRKSGSLGGHFAQPTTRRPL